jgi:hypothetical protein
MTNLVIFAVDVTAKTASQPIWQPLVIAAVTVSGYLLGVKLWVERRQGDSPCGSRRRHRRS